MRSNRGYQRWVKEAVCGEPAILDICTDAKATFEVNWALNENRLCKELGYSTPDLVPLTVGVVVYSGLKGINIKPGARIVVTPATGIFSGAAVGVAVAMVLQWVRLL